VLIVGYLVRFRSTCTVLEYEQGLHTGNVLKMKMKMKKEAEFLAFY